jgi:phosphatidylglycerol:prolipoprotein diacylglycerol transferase
VKPILFQFGEFSIHTFGLLVGLGFISGLWLASRLARQSGLKSDLVYELAVPWILIGSLLGARIVYVISYWDRDFAGRAWFEPFQVWRGGLVFYGGLIGGALAAIVRLRMLRQPLWRYGDCLAPGIALGHVFGRFGCLLNGCCFGHPTDVPWAIRFPVGTTPGNLPVHPTQIYEAVLNLGLAAGLAWFHRRRRFDGQVFALYLLGYSLVRAFTEWFRGDYDVRSAPLQGILTPGQATGIAIFLGGLGLYFVLRRLSPASPAPAAR